MKREILAVAAVTAVFLATASVQAKDIVHDAEYYILEKQNGERWSAEDTDLDKRLAEFRVSAATRPPISMSSRARVCAWPGCTPSPHVRPPGWRL